MVDGIAEMKRKLTQTIPKQTQEAARRAMEKGADDLVAMMKRLAPVLKEPDDRRRAGALRDSIAWTWGDAPAGSIVLARGSSGRQYGTMRITVYAGTRDKKLGSDDAFYARWVEFGTQKMTAQPFFFPAYRTRKRSIRSRITREIKKALKAQGGAE